MYIFNELVSPLSLVKEIEKTKEVDIASERGVI